VQHYSRPSFTEAVVFSHREVCVLAAAVQAKEAIGVEELVVPAPSAWG